MEISPILFTCFLVLGLPSCDGGQFWHISDLHMDYQYIEGGNMTNWCHKINATNTTPSINSDIVGPAGNYHCDSPAALVESALLAMQRLNPSPDFIVWTGDSAPHWRDPVPDETYIFNVTKHVFTRLDKLFPSIPIIPALGNHDASPPDQFPQFNPDNDNKTNTDGGYYKKLWQKGAFGDHINDSEASKNFLNCGFYSKVVKPTNSSVKLKFIVLNTNIYYHDDLTSGKDPCGQLEWLSETLKNIDTEKEKVFIVAHVPPGSFERNPGLPNFNSPEKHKTEINKQFIQIVTDPRYSGKIMAHLYGHLHTDTFRVLLDRATRRDAVGVAFMAGSVTPVVWGKNGVVGVNPTIRLMEYSNEDASLIDYKEYSLDIVKAAKNETVENVKNESVISLTSQSDQTQQPKSRRKNAKFLQSAQSEQENVGRKKRESLDSENPAADTNSPLVKPDTKSSVSEKEVPATQTIVPDNFTVIQAVPGSSNKTDGGDEADHQVTMVPLKYQADLNETVVNASSTSTTESNAVDQVIEGDKPNNVTQITATTSTTQATTMENTSTATLSEPDYPTYLSKQWTLLYKASTSYSVPNLSPVSMFSALKLMVEGGHESQVFVNYYEHNTGGHIVDKCSETCWREQLCTVSNLVINELAVCLNSTGKEGFYEVHKVTTAQPTPTTPRRKGLGEGEDDPDHADHGLLDHSHDHDGDGVEDHSHEDHHAGKDDDHDKKFHDHNDDGIEDHEHKDHADEFPSVSDEKDVSKEKLEDTASDISSRAVAIFFGVFAVAIVALAAGMGYKKYRDNRYRNQEFLLTDAVFRYDGYSQLDDA